MVSEPAGAHLRKGGMAELGQEQPSASEYPSGRFATKAVPVFLTHSLTIVSVASGLVGLPGQRLFELCLHDLAGAGFRQIGHDYDTLRRLVPGERQPAMGDEILT